MGKPKAKAEEPPGEDEETPKPPPPDPKLLPAKLSSIDKYSLETFPGSFSTQYSVRGKNSQIPGRENPRNHFSS